MKIALAIVISVLVLAAVVCSLFGFAVLISALRSSVMASTEILQFKFFTEALVSIGFLLFAGVLTSLARLAYSVKQHHP